jgi:hypothetical protein
MIVRAFLLAPLIGLFAGNFAAAIASGRVSNIFSVFLIFVCAPIAYGAMAVIGLPLYRALQHRPNSIHVWYTGALVAGSVIPYAFHLLSRPDHSKPVPLDLMAFGVVAAAVTAFSFAQITRFGKATKNL